MPAIPQTDLDTLTALPALPTTATLTIEEIQQFKHYLLREKGHARMHIEVRDIEHFCQKCLPYANKYVDEQEPVYSSINTVAGVNIVEKKNIMLGMAFVYVGGVLESILPY